MKKAMQPNEIILKVAGEGGSIVLYGLRNKTGWLFSRELIELDAEMPGNSLVDRKQTIAKSLADGLKLLDRNPWHMLSPILVHPEFRADILTAVTERCAKLPKGQSSSQHKWEKLCAPSVPGSAADEITKYQTLAEAHSSDSYPPKAPLPVAIFGIECIHDTFACLII